MAYVKDEKLEKQVSDAVLSPRLSEGTITEIKECPSIETSSGNSDNIKLASQQLQETCISPILEHRTRFQKVKDCLTFRKPLNILQVLIFMFSLIALIARLCIAEKELVAEFCSLFLSILVGDMITMYYDRGYYAKSVFEDSHPRKAFVDSPEKLSMTNLKNAASHASVYAKFQSTSSTCGHARALVHPRPPNVPESPVAISEHSDPYAVPGPSGLQKSP